MNSVRATAGQRFLLAGVAGRQAIARQVRRTGLNSVLPTDHVS
jgi:hypothetical protein